MGDTSRLRGPFDRRLPPTVSAPDSEHMHFICFVNIVDVILASSHQESSQTSDSTAKKGHANVWGVPEISQGLLELQREQCGRGLTMLPPPVVRGKYLNARLRANDDAGPHPRLRSSSTNCSEGTPGSPERRLCQALSSAACSSARSCSSRSSPSSTTARSTTVPSGRSQGSSTMSRPCTTRAFNVSMLTILPCVEAHFQGLARGCPKRLPARRSAPMSPSWGGYCRRIKAAFTRIIPRP